MVIIQNDTLLVEISETGAELQRVFNKKTNIEYLWNGDNLYWGRRAPLLFPIVGKLKEGKMRLDSGEYYISQHGFVRDMIFELNDSTTYRADLMVRSNQVTKKMYPFDWVLQCRYTLKNNMLDVKTIISNDSSDSDMLFSVGYHPAFRVPLEQNLTFSDYYLRFNKDTKHEKSLLKDGLIDDKTVKGFDNYTIPLSEDTFLQDALVFKGLKSNEILLKSDKTKHGIKFTFDGFPYLGIWSKPGASFVCIEPWHGIADSVHHDGDFSSKEGLIKLEAGRKFMCGYEIELN